MNEFLYKKSNGKIQCLLCPNNCVLANGKYGLCKTRKADNDKIINPYSGIISSSGIDPIEKKPLYHFMPGSTIFSVGFFGCTLKCQFCQNYSISQYHPEIKEKKVSPLEIVEMLKDRNIKSIAFTYSEPTLYFEWVIETAKLCRENNIKTVLVTNGYLNEEPAKILLSYIDAANIDFKSISNDFYKNLCSGKVEPVKKFIELSYNQNVHLEVTTLVITDTNDSGEEMEEISHYIHSISPDIPFHISRYHPEYKFEKPATSIQIIDKLVEIAKKKLNFVYGGNIMGHSDTFCKNCGELLIKRDFYSTSIRSAGNDGKCNICGEYNNIIF